MQKLAAIIVENRKTPNFPHIVKQHLKWLPQETKLFLVGDTMVDHAGEFMFCGFTGVHGKITQINSIDEYNLLLTNPVFWQNFLAYERVLIFQSDSMLLRFGIEEFYTYDYVGAPWPWQQHGGNGGLSLRNPRLMKEICEKYPFVPGAAGNEDVYFCNHMHNKAMGMLAPYRVCKSFSVESIYAEGTMGYHAIDKYLSPAQCETIKNQYNK